MEFEFYTRPGVSLRDQFFYVTFNSLRIAYVAPSSYERRKYSFEVKGEKGANVLTIIDDGVGDHYGNGVDNFALFEIRSL